jgi:hypothetical protein
MLYRPRSIPSVASKELEQAIGLISTDKSWFFPITKRWQREHAGEQLLRDYVSELKRYGISPVIVSGDIIEGTIPPFY